MPHLNEFSTWSITAGCVQSRLSMWDDAGQEFFVLLPRTQGRAWREEKARAGEMIEEAMAAGCNPGRVFYA